MSARPMNYGPVASMASVCAALLIVITSAVADDATRAETPIKVLARTSISLPTAPGVAFHTSIVRSRAELDRAAGVEIARRVDDLLGQPRIDFNRYMVVCVSAGNQSTSGYGADVRSVNHRRADGKSQVVVRWSLYEPKSFVLQVLTTPATFLLVERTDGEPVFERVAAPTDADERANAGVADPAEWKELLKSYQALGLPLPPADAPLVATLYEMVFADVGDVPVPLHRPQYLLGFLVPGADQAANPRLLIGTELIEIDPDQVQTLVRVDPAKELPGEILMQNKWADFDINAGLPTAIQCYQRGWLPLADRLLAMQAKRPGGFGHPESVFYQPVGLPPLLELNFVAWADCGNRLADPASDRAAILKQLQKLSGQDPAFQIPDCWGLIQSLAATVQPSTAAAGSIERLVDDLVEMRDGQWDGRFLLGFPEALSLLARRGWEAVPVLLEHLEDRRLTRGISHSLNGAPPRLVSVGEVTGMLLRQLAGDSGLSWPRDPNLYFVHRDQVAAWWKEAQTSSEEDYLVRSVVPRMPESTRIYTPILQCLAHKYPQRLPAVYQRLLAERPDVNSWELVQAISASDMSRSDKMDLFIQGTKQPRVARQAEALEAIAAMDEHAFETFLIRSLTSLPESTPGRYVDCEQVALAQLCWKTNSLNVWHTLRDAARKADVGVRMEILDRIDEKSDLNVFRKSRVAELLLAFLDDVTVRDVTASREKYADCAAEMWPQLEVRNWAAYQLAAWLGLDVSNFTPRKPVTAEDWQRLRTQVAQHCEERRISADDPSSDEVLRAKDALRALGVILMESGERGEQRLTEANLAGTEIKDADLRHLRYLSDLNVVDLSGTSITDDGLKELARCRGLHAVFLADTRITNAGLAYLAGFKGLQRLDLSHTGITDSGLEKLAGLIHLENLDLSDNEISNDGLPVLSKLLSLEQLLLRGTAVTDAGLAHLSAVPRLANLDLAGTDVSDSGMKALGECKKLEALTLSLTKVSDAGLPHLANLPQLRRLYLFGLRITDKGAAALGTFRGLTTLSLTGQDITDQGVKSLCQLQDLEILYLPQTAVTDQGVRELGALKKLTRLDLSGTAITNRAIESLRLMKNLNRVVLSDTKITPEAKLELRRALPDIQILE